MATEQTVAYVQHAMPGRIRLKVPARRGDRSFFEALERQLAGLPDVQQVEVNPLTASILIRHSVSPERMQELAAAVAGNARFVVGTPPVGEELRKRLATARREVESITGGAGLDMPTTVFLGLVGLSVVQIARGQVLAPAATLLWYATAMLLRSRKRQA